MNIFVENDYRKILKSEFAARKLSGNNPITYDSLASACRVQKTFISRVFNRQAHFSHDQLYAIANFFNLDSDSLDYLNLLLDFSRAGTQARREFLWKKIEEVKKEKISTPAYLGPHKMEIERNDDRLALYYLQPLHQIVHVSLGIERFAKSPTQLSQALGVSAERLRLVLENLKAMGLIADDGAGVKVLIGDVYLPREHRSYEAWRSLVRGLTATRLQTINHASAYSFSVTFTASEVTRLRIQKKFLEFLSDAKSLCESSDNEVCFQMNFDLFPWT